MIEDYDIDPVQYAKDLKALLGYMSEDGEQIIAPCLAGVAHFETRDIGHKERWTEGPEWMLDGQSHSCKDTYELRSFPIGDSSRVIKAFVCVERCIMSQARSKPSEPYLNEGSIEHLLKIFTHEYLNQVL
jgi:hypothetical protein